VLAGRFDYEELDKNGRAFYHRARGRMKRSIKEKSPAGFEERTGPVTNDYAGCVFVEFIIATNANPRKLYFCEVGHAIS